VTPAFLCDFDECVARCILDTFACFVHEFEWLVDDSFKKFPMCFQETWILPTNVYDLGRDHSLVVFATLGFNNGDQETLFVFV
jgi:hypothetical protein